MTNQADLRQEIAQVEDQERRLVLSRFNHDDALALGLRLVAMAKMSWGPVESDITCGDHCLFHHAMEGTTAVNGSWIRRKRNTMLLTGTSSLLVFLRLALDQTTIAKQYGVVETEHAPGGGGFPLRVSGNIIGHVIVSGLPHRDDHALVVAALTDQLAS